jgi:hypothetical protein
VKAYRLLDSILAKGVQNPHRGGANAPPSLFLKALSRAASEAYSLNDRQGGKGVHIRQR